MTFNSHRSINSSFVMLALAGVVMLLSSMFALPSSAKVADSGTDSEVEMLELINKERTSRGIQPLAGYWDVSEDARGHALVMANANTIFHSSVAQLSSYTTGALGLGENVGKAPSVSSLHAAYMGSSGHAANVLNPSFTHIGIGMTAKGGYFYNANVFVEYPSAWVPAPGSHNDTHLTASSSAPDQVELATFNVGWARWAVTKPDGSAFWFSSAFSPAVGWETLLGDFNGDGKDDIANFYPPNGTFWVTVSNGQASAPTSLWQTYSPSAGWEHHVGDFNGDGKDDVLSYHPGNATFWVSTSTGSSFTTKKWAQWSINKWMVQVTDHNGDGKDDFIAFAPANQTWWFGRSTGASFVASLIP